MHKNGYIILTDFGLSTFQKDSTGTIGVGTTEYMSPEQINCDKYGKPVDWWAVGVIIYEMS